MHNMNDLREICFAVIANQWLLTKKWLEAKTMTNAEIPFPWSEHDALWRPYYDATSKRI